MPVMFCNFNMFDLTSQVFVIKDNKDMTPLYTGTFEDICEFLATEYASNKYEKILLAGAYAGAVEDRVRTYSSVNYNNFNINIEVVK